jgi:hypothetical protein
MSKKLLLAVFLLSCGIGQAQLAGLPAPSVNAPNDGVHLSGDFLYCNTTQPSILSTITNAQGWGGSTASSTCTKYLLNVPSSPPTLTDVPSIMEFPAVASSTSQGTFTGATALTTYAQCLAAVTVTTPCIAAYGTANTLGTTGTTGTVVLYTTSAPANGVFEFCPNTFTDTAGTAGNINATITWTTPQGLAVSGTYGGTYAATSAYVGIQTCATFATKVNTTASFAIAAASATGSLSWEYAYVVRRLH